MSTWILNFECGSRTNQSNFSSMSTAETIICANSLSIRRKVRDLPLFLEDAAVPLSRLFFASSAYFLFLAVTSAVLTLAAGCRSCVWTVVHAIYVYHQAQWLACVGNPFVKNKKIFSNFLFVSCNTSILGACSSRFYELEESPARANLPLPALDVMGWLTG